MVSVNHGDEFALGFFLHLDAEVDEDKEGDTADEGVDRSAHCQGIVYSVRHDRNQEDREGILCRTIHEMVERVIISHQHGESIVTGNGK